MPVGEVIRIERHKKKLTQRQLAEKIKVSTSTITGYEKGSINIPYNRLKSIANALEVPMSILVEE